MTNGSTCSVDTCDENIDNKKWSLCNIHYKRFLKYDDPLGGGALKGSTHLHRGPYAGCWEWAGSVSPAGYGRVNLKQYDTLFVHRIVFNEIYGWMPDLLRHRCDNPLCYRPDHLLSGTKADNSRDMVERGRSTRGERNPMAKTTEAVVRKIKRELAKGKLQRVIAADCGVDERLVSAVNTGRRWNWVTIDGEEAA